MTRKFPAFSKHGDFSKSSNLLTNKILTTGIGLILFLPAPALFLKVGDEITRQELATVLNLDCSFFNFCQFRQPSYFTMVTANTRV